MIALFLLDVAPDPPSAAIGIGVLVVLALVVLAFAFALTLGFVFLLVWRKRRKANTAMVAGDSPAQSSIPNQ